jgi:predicted alpha/beta-fold hydrolase
MPLVSSNYKPPFLLRNGHFSTIYSGVFRKVHGLQQKRERLELADGDFLDLDWSNSISDTNKVVILIHGVEGNAQRHYITGSAKKFNQNNFDVCAINLRGCSGEQNRLYRSYHAGATEDLEAVINYILENRRYNQIYIKGFSLGGNLVLKYIGESRTIYKEIKAAIAISAPCDLYDSQIQFLKISNKIYGDRFKKQFKKKLRQKQLLYPNLVSKIDIKKLKTLKGFDDLYTSKAHGFIDALDYYEKCSCKQFLPSITIPSLIINAKNDSFLGEACYPFDEALANPNLHLEVPDFGGHVSFWGKKNSSYAEERGVEFLKSI